MYVFVLLQKVKIEKQANKIRSTIVLVVAHRFYLTLLFFEGEIYIRFGAGKFL
jgi:hypothetical protein